MASLTDEVDLLRRIPLFANIDAKRLKLLAFCSERAIFDAGQELFHQGDAGDAAYVVIEGAADVLVDTPKGALKITTLGRNDFVGEIAILCDVPRTASVRAVGPLTTLKIEKDHFLRLVRDFPEIAIETMRVLASRLTKTTGELTDARRRISELGG